MTRRRQPSPTTATCTARAAVLAALLAAAAAGAAMAQRPAGPAPVRVPGQPAVERAANEVLRAVWQRVCRHKTGPAAGCAGGGSPPGLTGAVRLIDVGAGRAFILTLKSGFHCGGWRGCPDWVIWRPAAAGPPPPGQTPGYDRGWRRLLVAAGRLRVLPRRVRGLRVLRRDPGGRGAQGCLSREYWWTGRRYLPVPFRHVGRLRVALRPVALRLRPGFRLRAAPEPDAAPVDTRHRPGRVIQGYRVLGGAQGPLGGGPWYVVDRDAAAFPGVAATGRCGFLQVRQGRQPPR